MQIHTMGLVTIVLMASISANGLSINNVFGLTKNDTFDWDYVIELEKGNDKALYKFSVRVMVNETVEETLTEGPGVFGHITVISGIIPDIECFVEKFCFFVELGEGLRISHPYHRLPYVWPIIDDLWDFWRNGSFGLYSESLTHHYVKYAHFSRTSWEVFPDLNYNLIESFEINKETGLSEVTSLEFLDMDPDQSIKARLSVERLLVRNSPEGEPFFVVMMMAIGGLTIGVAVAEKVKRIQKRS